VVKIASVAFPECYLRMDSNGVVNCQGKAGPWEEFEIVKPHGMDDAVDFVPGSWIRSVAFPTLLLHMAWPLTASVQFEPDGAGRVYGGPITFDEFYAAAILPTRQPDGSMAFQLATTDGVFLRMDGRGVSAQQLDGGGGTVNCQFGVGAWEKFIILD
jgi:hypothetical protein